MCCLEEELDAQLNKPGEVRLYGGVLIDRTELRTVWIGVVITLIVLWRIENVERLNANLQSHCFC